MPEQEQWRPVAGFPDYEVSDLGRVRTTGRILKARPDRQGYLIVDLRVGDRRTVRNVHVLVARAFDGPKPSVAHEVRHLDGDQVNNNATNLRWGTRSENALDRVLHGRDINARKTQCDSGHPFSERNTYIRPNGNRDCRACIRTRVAEYKLRRQMASAGVAA